MRTGDEGALYPLRPAGTSPKGRGKGVCRTGKQSDKQEFERALCIFCTGLGGRYGGSVCVGDQLYGIAGGAEAVYQAVVLQEMGKAYGIEEIGRAHV